MARGARMGDFSKEAIILNISIRGGRLFEGGDKSIDGYYSRKTVRSLRDLIGSRIMTDQ